VVFRIFVLPLQKVFTIARGSRLIAVELPIFYEFFIVVASFASFHLFPNILSVRVGFYDPEFQISSVL
jgi:hypothetical protein